MVRKRKSTPPQAPSGGPSLLAIMRAADIEYGGLGFYYDPKTGRPLPDDIRPHADLLAVFIVHTIAETFDDRPEEAANNVTEIMAELVNACQQIGDVCKAIDKL